jgi:hypothetical protein
MIMLSGITKIILELMAYEAMFSLQTHRNNIIFGGCFFVFQQLEGCFLPS